MIWLQQIDQSQKQIHGHDMKLIKTVHQGIKLIKEAGESINDEQRTRRCIDGLIRYTVTEVNSEKEKEMLLMSGFKKVAGYIEESMCSFTQSMSFLQKRLVTQVMLIH